MEPKVKPKVFQYTVGVRWTGEKRGKMTAAGKPDAEVATPPEFQGHPGIWSPEDLLVSAVNTCTMTTFLAFAAKQGLPLASYTCEATGTLEMADGKFRFTRIRLEPRIGILRPEDREKAITVFRQAERNCLVANSLNTTVEGEPQIVLAA
jgi:peroxiredoxin-like protein